MRQLLEHVLNIPYMKLHFTVAFLNNVRMPSAKVSALRGGMGQMLLRANCIRDRNCRVCRFEPECIVHRTLYTRYTVRPEFVTEKDSIGYILECEDDKESFSKGDQMQFTLILFGKTIVYFNEYIRAFTALGKSGVGRWRARYQIVSVTDTGKNRFSAEDSVEDSRHPLHTLGEYAGYRIRQMQKDGCQNRLVFQTPLTLKYRDKFWHMFQMQALWEAVLRRIYMLECYEGIPYSIYDYRERGIAEDICLPVIAEQVCSDAFVKRYSSTQKKTMTLWGIKGYAQLDDIPEEILPVLAAGELTHIGKNTSFGFGKYIIL